MVCKSVFLLVALALAFTEAKPKSVSVHLNAKWPSTPLALEASEFFSKQSNDLFWKFVDAVSELPADTYSDDTTDEKRYQLTIDVASKLLSPLQLKLLKFALSLRSYSPAVEMYNQIAREYKISAECNTFVKINNLVTCERHAMRAYVQLAKNEAKLPTMKTDHHYPGGEGRPVTVILYGQLMTREFVDWHTDLRQFAEEGHIDYVLRHFVGTPAKFNVRLSGYGVELAIKNQEYKAKDDTKVEGDAVKDGDDDEGAEDEMQGFIFSDLKKIYPHLANRLSEFRQHLVDSSSEMSELKVWEMQDLSFQAAQRVMQAAPEEALFILQDTSQNFPVQAKTLARIPVREEFKQEVQKNQRTWETHLSMGPGDNVLYVNGLQADLDAYDMFTLLDTLRNEARLLEGLHSLAEQYGVQPQSLMDFLKIDMRDTETNYGVDIRDAAVIYVNDLERDRRYSNWPGSVNDLLRPSFPGMLRHIRKNLFHLVFVVNPVNRKHMELLKLAEAFFVHNAPVRIGLVLVVNDSLSATEDTDPGITMWRACNYIFHHETPVKALSFVTDVYQAAADGAITSQLIREQLGQNFPESKLRKVFGETSQYDVKRSGGSLFVERTGLRDLPQVLVNGVPLRQEQLSPDDLEETIVTTILRLTNDLQKAVFNGFLHDRIDMLEYLMTRTNIMPRLNSRILNPVDKILDLTGALLPQSVLENPEAFSSLSAADMTSVVISAVRYLAKQDEKSTRAITVWVVADLDTKDGRALLYNAIKHLKATSHMRIAVIHNPVNPSGESSTGEQKLDVFAAYEAAITAMDTGMAKSFVTKLVKEENVEAIDLGEKTLDELAVHNMDVAQYNRAKASVKRNILKSYRTYCEKVLGFKPGQRGLIINGRVMGPLADDEPFITEDFVLLEKYTSKVFVDKLLDKANALNLDGARTSDLLMKVSAVIMFSPNKEARKEVKFAGDTHSVLHLPAKDQSGPVYDVVAILDPLTRAAQKYTPIIAVLNELFGCNVKIYFNCREKLSDLPLKNFYRYVLEPEVSFASDHSLSGGPGAKFHNMPVKPLLTLGMDPPDSWLVEVVKAAYDLDNIYLEEVDSLVQAEFELEYILMEGHCFDAQTGQPPRGLQFTLGTDVTPARFDTIVMANLGYFQLKATPGVWQLKLRSGRSKDLYEITSHEFTDSPSDSPNVTVVMDSFKSKIIRVRVQKQKGKEHEDLLADDEEQTGLWQSISNRFGNAKPDETETDKTLNIFSVASGHLYERFLRIMMLTVVQHTKSKVKFWFLKNYLSPQFKDFIPHMAKEYGFEVELVQYKWPRWLHHQTEKQRIIWGYKILFLDVLFPLNISKIIYVDADQTVRGDLQELADLDLEGAPYGYTPFCDSRHDMDGFRFWKSGYWASHLAGRRYHISALYVVDLKKFRRIAAGDRLRGQYQGLSQDPNSLSNLDQDLPNNMIHQVGIKSLPPEWLWCETWCSDAEKTRAKTIDLCNNPKTKEPKLNAAMRIIAEWKDNDQEIKQLYDRVYKSTPSSGTTVTSGSSATSSSDSPSSSSTSGKLPDEL